MLQDVSIYLSKVIVCSGIFALYYLISLRNKRFHYYNRFYILISVALSAVLPLLQLHWLTFSSTSSQAIHLLNIIKAPDGEDLNINGNSSFNYQQFLLLIAIVVSLIMFIAFCFSIIKIYKIKRKYPVKKLYEFDFIETDIPQAPFSFLKNIFWRTDISLSDETGKQILQHEIAHIEQKHSWDKLFMQSVLCFYWMNPFYYLLKKELYLIHEFAADEKAVKQSDADAFAKMLLAARFGKFQLLPAQPFFYSSIKRRLIMLTTSKKTKFSYVRRILVLPLIAAIVCLFSFSVKNISSVSPGNKIISGKSFVLVVDAGHGGKDYGAEGNGLYEKNIALKIAQKIKSLSSEYGIDVVLTRNDDVFMSPPEKSDFANTQNANAFISIHVNSAGKETDSSGMDVFVAQNNTQELSNELLGSAILQSLQQDFKTPGTLSTRKVGIWVLKNSAIPAALIECGYITNSNDAKVLKNDAKIELMARNILQGVSAYANNTIDKSKLLPLRNKDAKDTSLPEKSNSMLQAKEPLYVLDGKIISKSVFEKSSLQPDEIMSINILKDKYATDKYGDKAKNGVVEITSKKSADGDLHAPLASLPPSNAPSDTAIKPVFTQAENEPQFPGGIEGWKNYLMQNLKADVPAKNHAPNGIYTVTLSFLIDENGNVSDVKTVKDPGFGTGKEAVRIIAQGPKWIPATQNGQNVAFMEKQNISFRVSE